MAEKQPQKTKNTGEQPRFPQPIKSGLGVAPSEMWAQIAQRAKGGKVAIVEKGRPPRVVDATEMAEACRAAETCTKPGAD